MSKSKKIKNIQRILDALREKADLSTNKGPLISSKRRPTKKDRRHRGWRTPNISNPMMKFSDITKNALEPKIEYDDWEDFRDGMRYNPDRKHFFRKWRAWCFDEEEVFKINKKIKKQREIRKAKEAKKK